MRRAAFVLTAAAVGAFSCGGEERRDLTASFALCAPELRVALVERFPELITPESAIWPEEADSVAVELSVVRRADVDVSAEKDALRGSILKTWPAEVSVEGAASPLELVELFGGPSASAGIDDAAVVLLGHGAPGAEASAFVWTEDGARWFGHALQGALPEQADAATFSLFLRGRARLVLAPGEALPDGAAASNVVVTVPLRSGP